MGQKVEPPTRPRFAGFMTMRSRLRGRITASKPVRQFLVQEGFFRRVTVLAGGTAIGQAIVVISAPLLTRLYLPSDFGVLTVYVSLLSFLLGIASWRYHMAIPMAETDQGAASLVVLCFALLLGMAAVLAIIVVILGPRIVLWAQAPKLKPFLWLLPLSFLGAGAFQILTAWSVRTDAFGLLARSKLNQSVGQVVTQIAFSLITRGPMGLLVGDAFGRMGGSISLSRSMWRHLHEHFRAVNIQSVMEIGSRYRRFPLISSGASFLSTSGEQMPTLLLASFYGPTVVGWFGLVQRMLSVSFLLIASAVGTVYLSESAKLSHDNPERLLQLYWKTASRSLLLASIIAAAVILITPFLFGPIFGPQWVGATRFAQLLAIPAGLQFANRAVSSTTIVLERQDLEFASQLVWIISGTGTIILARALRADPLACITMFSVGYSFSCIFGLTMSWHAVQSAVRRWKVDKDVAITEVQG